MQGNYLFLTNRHLQDLNPLLAGTHECDPGYGTQPAIRKHVLIHYVFRGKGTLFINNTPYPVKQGQAFLITPGTLAHYQADTEDPWYYGWIGFDGALGARFAELPPVFSLPEEVFRRILRNTNDPSVTEYRMASELFRLYALLFSDPTRLNPHVRQVENYIRSSYMHPIRVEHIAQQLNLDRRYLSRLFKEKTGLSMQQYLLNVRMDEATNYLRQGYSVKECAHMVGYEDVSNFSKLYKRHFGTSPAHHKKVYNEIYK